MKRDDAETAKLVQKIDKTIANFEGDITVLEGAIGCFLMAQNYGIKPMQLIHSKRTMAKYKEVLPSLDWETLPDVNEKNAQRLNAWRMWHKVMKHFAFWQVANGDKLIIDGERVIVRSNMVGE